MAMLMWGVLLKAGTKRARAKLKSFCRLYTASYYHIVTRIVLKVGFLLVAGMLEIARS